MDRTPSTRERQFYAAVIDTGASYVITDLRSANGIETGGQRVQLSATLAHGDRIRIGDHEFIFEMPTR